MSNIEAFQCYIIILATDAFMIYLDINVTEANASSLMSYFIHIHMCSYCVHLSNNMIEQGSSNYYMIE